jgi:Fibronectin type III domain
MMRRPWFGWLLVSAVVGVAAAATVLVPAAASRPGRSACQPSVDSLAATATSPTTAVITASFSSGGSSGGTWTIDISSPQTTTFGGDFLDSGGSINESLGHLLPNTHYRGTLTVRSDCGSVDALIDFRTPNAPPPPTCTGPPGIDSLDVPAVGVDSAVLTYTVSSGDGAAVDVQVNPGGTDLTNTTAPPSGSGTVPLSGLVPNTTYTVTVRARNGCGQSMRQTTFTTLRATDCSRPPTIGRLRVDAISSRSARVRYAVASDGAVATKLVAGLGTEVDRTISAPGGAGTVALRGLKSATQYQFALTATNACGQVADSGTFVSLGRVAIIVVGSGRVTSAPGRISCPHSCAADFKAGTTVLLVERSAPGWRFASWAGACRGSARVCKVTARDAHVTARFKRSA